MYVAFLRGINVSGKNQIQMGELVAAFEGLGYQQVSSYLSTGNVLFEATALSCEALEADIEAIIKATFQLEISVIVKDKSAIEAIVSNYPFTTDDEKNRYVILFKTEVSDVLKPFIDAAKLETDGYQLMGNYVYLLIPTGYGKTKLNNSFFEKKTGLVATTRNMNTFEKLLSLTK